ncbi:putative immunoglobulin superfamily member 10 isoform X3 [Apostichopus japonicus]|uniref:Putative immunoglobulin superfamily member 10 isoform X3 n=1 Tax=Stichopus japonicus TaxID=307972 RepID=A0A2G8JNS5_STIJA|nr:putative immunoglobulin superfamily member 10 isoform X3 [Apostichopus japonicus]PIK37380.1 putative immunoglobulin superfamily member 10 isoform X3 [Apostichopus japonicus]
MSFNKIINLALPHPSKELCGGLESLNFSFNQITSITEESLRGMVKLATLDLSNNYISVLSSEPFSSLFKLEYLNLSFNIISRLSLQAPQLLKEINLNANCLNTITIETNFLKFIYLSCNLFTSVPILYCTHKSNVYIGGNQFDCSDEFPIRHQNSTTCNYICIPEVQCKNSCNENKIIISSGKGKTTSSQNSPNDQAYSTHINDSWMSTLVLDATTTTATSQSFEIGGNNTSQSSKGENTFLGTSKSFWCVVAVSGATFILLFLTLYKWYLTKKEFLRYSRQDEVYGLPAMSHRCPRTSPELIAMQRFQDAHESQPSVTGLGELSFNENNLGRVNTRIMATTVNENDIMKQSVGASRVVVLRPKRSLTRTRTIWSWI